jgi:asparagine synthase (glutamine-hydrolysing)
MADPETGSWIVHNGEVYNFRALRAKLPRRDRRSETDTEAVLQAYGTWGKACVERFRGMFGFAIWDAWRRELFLARDRFGIKPLYYYLGGASSCSPRRYGPCLRADSSPGGSTPWGCGTIWGINPSRPRGP